MASMAPSPSDPAPSDPAAAPRRFRGGSVVALLASARSVADDPADLVRRRRLVSAATIICGAVGLALALRMDHDSPLFNLAALGVAAVWAVGAALAGPLHLGTLELGGKPSRAVVPAFAIGAAIAAASIAAAFVVARIPFLADQVRDVLAFRQSGSLVVLGLVTALSGVAEELFFRGALWDAIPARHRIWGTTLAYTVATALAGNPMLALAAAFLGLIVALERRATGGVLAPIITHLTWSLAMLYLLPLVL